MLLSNLSRRSPLNAVDFCDKYYPSIKNDLVKRQTKAKNDPPEKSFLTEYDIYLLKQGNHFRLFDKLGAHLTEVDGAEGTRFAVWGPNAGHVSVIGDFNNWRADAHFLKLRPDESGVWEGFVPGVGRDALY